MPKQLRGDALKQAIIDGIRALASQSESYTYNATHLANLIGTSRVTLNKYSDLIDKELNRINAERRTSSGSALVVQLLQKITRLENEKKELQKELNTLRQNHIEIYERLYLNSYDISQLIKPVIIKELNHQIKCAHCGSPFQENQIKTNNIVQLHPEGDK